MTIEVITVVMFGSLAGLLIFGMPMAYGLGIIGVVASYFAFGWAGVSIISSRVYGFVNSYVLIAVPMFLLMASILDRSGVAKEMYEALKVWSRRLPGGVAIMTLLAGVMMAATTGIIGGEIILLGLVALPQMLRLGYDKGLAIGTICAGGSLGTMIPPSIVLIFYGLTANVSIGELFLASTIPGLLLATLYLSYIIFRCIKNPELAPAPPREEWDIPLSQKLLLLKDILLPLAIAVSVLGSIYMGYAAVSEAAAVGAAASLVVAAAKRKLSYTMVKESLIQVMAVSGMLLWVIFGATAFIGAYNLLGGISFMKDTISSLPFSPLVIILIMMGILILLGMFMDWVGILLLTMPIFVPVIVDMGYDPIWFGVLFCMNMQISYLSPPFGPACFYLKGVAPPEISITDIYKAVLPFIALQAIGLTLVLFFPQIALWLPSALY